MNNENSNNTALDFDTIAALATPPGRGGVGIIRVSGPKAVSISQAITNTQLKPRFAHYSSFLKQNKKTVIDQGISIFFQGPNSFTGEDVVEFQGHGGPYLLDSLLKEIISLGARMARPGEFSERAYLNNKIDLTQAEAIADLINSASEQAARSAMRSLEGEFSRQVYALVKQITELRVYVEAAIDFPEEEVDFLADGHVAKKLVTLIKQLDNILVQAKQGALLQEGMTVVIAGKPNAGKSSLLNALSGKDSAIVTDIAGTTRDVLREHIQIDGMPLHIIDTAGLRESPDTIEREGIRRAWEEIEKADRILLVVDSSETLETKPAILWPDFSKKLPSKHNITVIQNKIDLNNSAEKIIDGNPTIVKLSTKNNAGILLLKQHLKEVMGYQGATEGGFMARRRHIDALNRAKELMLTGQHQLQTLGAGELLAEDLRQSQQTLSEITGEFTPDDLLGEIFSNFCIGK